MTIFFSCLSKLKLSKELNRLFTDLVNHYDIELDINKWIRAQAKTFNPSVISAIQKLLPARTMMPAVGVLIKPTFLHSHLLPHQ